MPNRTDIRSLQHAFVIGALSLALSLPAQLQAQATTPSAEPPAASLLDLPSTGTTPPPATAVTLPANPEAKPDLPTMPSAAKPLVSDTLDTTATPQQAVPLPLPTAPLKDIPPTPVAPTPVAPASVTPTPVATAPSEPVEEIKRKVEIIQPKIISLPGTTPPIELLESPLKLDKGLSLMFTEEDMFSLVIPSLELYDKTENRNDSISGTNEPVDDLTGLLESLKLKGEDKVQEAPQVLPNIYLGSIMYYSPSNWSIWLNGKKLTNAVNAPANPLYVEAIDRTHVRLIWKPASMTALNKVLNNRKIATPEVLDIDGSKVTVTLRPNQTFVVSLLAVLEGMVKQTAVPEQAPSNAAPVVPEQPTTPAMPAKGKFMDKRIR